MCADRFDLWYMKWHRVHCLLPVHAYTETLQLRAATNKVTVGSSDTDVQCMSYFKLIEWTCLIGAVSTANWGIWQAGNDDIQAWILTRMHLHVHTHMHTQISPHAHTHMHAYTYHTHTGLDHWFLGKKATTTYTHTHSLSHTYTHVQASVIYALDEQDKVYIFPIHVCMRSFLMSESYAYESCFLPLSSWDVSVRGTWALSKLSKHAHTHTLSNIHTNTLW